VAEHKHRDKVKSQSKATNNDCTRGITSGPRAKLLQRDLTHDLVAHDFTNLHSLHCALASSIRVVNYLVYDWVHLVTQPVQGRHVPEFLHQDVEAVRSRGIAKEDFVIHDEALLFRLVIPRLEYFGQRFEVIIPKGQS
jgi:hypothetical protein